MNKFFIRWVANGVAIWAVFQLFPRITPINEGMETIIFAALIFGLVNALIRPIISFLTCPLIILTLGLGTLIINAGMLVLTGWIGQQFGVGFTVEGFLPALGGAIVVSIVSGILSTMLGDNKEHRHRDD